MLVPLKKALQKSAVYPTTRAVYRRLFMPERVAELVSMRTFYGQFFLPGDVVFDVGANYGEYAEAFADAGATVVAIEPNPDLRPRLEVAARGKAIFPETVALGEERGRGVLNLSSIDLFSTLAPTDSDWVRNNPDYTGSRWVGQVEVPVVTADDLVGKYGPPAFVKIDVEGFEIKVLRGLSARPKYISFEFGVQRKSLALECLAYLAERGYRFRPINAKAFRFATADWLTGSQASGWLERRGAEISQYGDFFAYLWPA